MPQAKPLVDAGWTVTGIVSDAVMPPEVPVIAMLEVPVVAVLLAVSVSRLVPAVGLVANAAVTPVGRLEAASVTDPVNPFTSMIVIVSVAVLPCTMEIAVGEAPSVKLPGDEALIVMMIVKLQVRVPEVQAMVTTDVPAGAVELAVNVKMVEAPNGLAPNAAVTPVGMPDAIQVTLPVNVPKSTTVRVSVALAP